MKRFLIVLLLLCLCIPMALAEEIEVVELDDTDETTETTETTVTTATGEFPPLNANGFLDEGEFVFEDEENGIWRFCSQTLRIEIYRRTQKSKPKLVWYEAEIFAAEGEAFDMLSWSDTNRWKNLNYPYQIAREHKTVFAVNSDFAHLRISKKMVVGIVIRDGEIVSSRTNKKNKAFPNYDTLVLMPDGDMKVYWSNELKAQDYLDMGADDVLAFGPYMIRDGELNKTALKKFATGSAPRTAIGMAEKGHYFAIVTEGRNKRSNGCSVQFCAERLLELGCTLAFNLDGGQSSAMIFMGRQLNLITNDYGNKASARKAAEILGIGISDQVAAEDDPF